MSIENNALTPDRFPILNEMSDSAVVWVISNNVDYHITLGSLKELMIANLPPAELPTNIVTTEELIDGLSSKVDVDVIEGFVTAQQLADAIANIAPLDIASAVANYFSENPLETNGLYLTSETLEEDATIAAIREALAKKLGSGALEGYATIDDLEIKADKSELEGLVTLGDVSATVASLLTSFQPVNYTPEGSTIEDHLRAIDLKLGTLVGV